MGRDPDRQQLHDALVHVRFTLDQLLAALYWQRLEPGLLHKQIPLTAIQAALLKNACIDSSLCSLRILDEFFRHPGKDHVVAKYYGFKHGSGILSGADRRLVNNHVSHLTWKRVSEPILEFNFGLIIGVLPICARFLEHLVVYFLTDLDREMVPCWAELDAFTQARAYFNV